VESEDVAQDEHGDLARRQRLQGGHEGQGDGFGLLVAGLWPGRHVDGTLYAQQVLGYSALKFGISSVVLALGATAGAITGQGAVLKAGFRPVAVTGLALMGAGSLVLMQVSVHGSYFPVIFFGLLLGGLGIGLAFVTATVAALAGVAGQEAGLASDLSNTALQIGSALGVAIVTSVAASRSQHYLAENKGANPLAALTEGYQSAFVACVVLAGIGLALALLLPGRPPKIQHQLPEPASVASTN